MVYACKCRLQSNPWVNAQSLSSQINGSMQSSSCKQQVKKILETRQNITFAAGLWGLEIYVIILFIFFTIFLIRWSFFPVTP